MENILLVKIQTNVNQRKRIYTITFCQKFLTKLKSRILTIKIGVTLLLEINVHMSLFVQSQSCEIQVVCEIPQNSQKHAKYHEIC